MSRSVPGVSSGCLWGFSGPGFRSVQKVSRECPRSVKKVSRTLRNTLGTLFGLSGARGPKGPRNCETPRGKCPGDHPRDIPGTLRAREIPVAGRGCCKQFLSFPNATASKKAGSCKQEASNCEQESCASHTKVPRISFESSSRTSH